MRSVTFALFLAVALGILTGLHLLIWARLIRDPGLGPIATRALTAGLVLLGASVPASFWLGRVLPPDRGRALLLALNVWFGVLFWLVVGLLAADLVLLLVRGVARLGGSPLDPERRRLLARGVAVTLVALVGGAIPVAMHRALAPVAVREVNVTLARLPERLSGFTLVQLSDLHLGPTLRREFVERVVAQVNALDADTVVITGDLVDGPVERLRGVVAPLQRMRARQGVHFVTGNHEYYAGAEAWCQELERLGLRVLRNERVALGAGDATFDLAGVYDRDAERHPADGHRTDLAAALAGRDPSREVVLLAHQPRAIREALQHDVGLVLSGHTHGGQIWPWQRFVRLQQPAVRGLFRFGPDGRGVRLDPGEAGEPGGTRLYVSSGTGFWGPPLRLGTRAEITLVRLLARDGAPAS